MTNTNSDIKYYNLLHIPSGYFCLRPLSKERFFKIKHFFTKDSWEYKLENYKFVHFYDPANHTEVRFFFTNYKHSSFDIKINKYEFELVEINYDEL